MHLHLGSVPETAAVSPAEGWVRLREPPLWVVLWVISIPISLILAFIAAALVIRFTEISREGLSIGGLVAVYFGTIAVHELIHAVVHPDRGLSKNTLLGLWPSRLMFFAHYEGIRSKQNFMFGLVAPFLFLTLVPLMASVIFGWSSWTVGALIILNAFFSSADVFGFFCVLLGVPTSAVVQNCGWRTYWRFRREEISSNNALQPIVREDARSG